MLTVMHGRMTERGYVSIPREDLAEVLGVHSSQITKWTKEAIAAGLLDKVGGGYHGRSAEFCAVLPTTQRVRDSAPNSDPGEAPKVTSFGSPLEGGKVTSSTAPSSVKTGHHLSGKPDTKGDQKQVTQYARAYISESRERNDHQCDAGVERDHGVTEVNDPRGAPPPVIVSSKTSNAGSVDPEFRDAIDLLARELGASPVDPALYACPTCEVSTSPTRRSEDLHPTLCPACSAAVAKPAPNGRPPPSSNGHRDAEVIPPGGAA
jgi:hypothetical protein